MTINKLFANENEVTTNGGRELEGTAQLVNISNTLAANVLRSAEVDGGEEMLQRIALSMTDTKVLDDLAKEAATDESVDTEFLTTIDETVLESMLKSQQSKRSRCKSKTMTTDNYTSMLSAAIAEFFIRKALGKEKSAINRSRGGAIEITSERLEELAADQEALRKEIRNVQSKKSIMKSKAGFSEDDERWQALLVVEEQLKAIRETRTSRAVGKVVEEDPLRDMLKGMLAEVDPQNMKAADLKELLKAVKENAFDDATQEDEDEEEAAE